MFYKMTYQKDTEHPFKEGPEEKPNLYKRQDGRWAIQFSWREFKNWRYVAKKNYDVGLPDYATDIIQDFINDVRPKIDPNDHRDLLFIASPRKNKQIETGSSFLQALYADVTAKYLKKELHPHSARHLVASSIIFDLSIRNPWQVAADVLHDSEKTVREFYATLVAEPGSDAYHESIADTFGDLKEENEEGDRAA
jgi:hypothetical protein